MEAADEFLLEGDKHPRRRLDREQFLEQMAARAAVVVQVASAMTSNTASMLVP